MEFIHVPVRSIVGSILDVGEQEASARIAFAYLGERFDRLRVDIVHDALGARARRVGIGAERRESAETLEPAHLRLELKLSTLGLSPDRKRTRLHSNH